MVTHFGEVLTEALCGETNDGDRVEPDFRIVDCANCLDNLGEGGINVSGIDLRAMVAGVTHFGEVMTEILCGDDGTSRLFSHCSTDLRDVDCVHCLGDRRDAIVKSLRAVDARIVATSKNPKFTLLVYRAPYESTNEWNNFSGIDWEVMTRGIFATRNEACAWAREHLLPGAPFTLSPVDCAE